MDHDGVGQKLAGCGMEPPEGPEELGPSVKDTGKGRIQSKGVQDIFKEVVQAVLIFGEEKWLINPRIGRSLGRVRHRVSRQIIGRKQERQVGGSLEYLTLETSMQEAGFKDMGGGYVLKRHNMAAQYIVTWKILDLCKETVRIPVKWVAKRWR